MININNVNKRIADTLESIVGTTYMIINKKYLHTIPQNQLSMPRIIFDNTAIKDSEFYYKKESFNVITDKFDRQADRVSKMSYTIMFVTNVNDDKALEYIEHIRDYLNFPEDNRIIGITSKIRYVGNIQSSTIKNFENIEQIHMLSFNLDVDNKYIEKVDYAETLEGTVKVDGTEMDFSVKI